MSDDRPPPAQKPIREFYAELGIAAEAQSVHRGRRHRTIVNPWTPEPARVRQPRRAHRTSRNGHRA